MGILTLFVSASLASSLLCFGHASIDTNVESPVLSGKDAELSKQANDTATVLLDCDGEPVVYKHAQPSLNEPTSQAALSQDHAMQGSGSLPPFNSEHFRIDYVDSSLKHIPAARAVLRAPIHTCTIRQFPGVRTFLADHPGIPAFSVQPYAQPPNLNFYTGEDELLERVAIHEEATSEEVASFLLSRGFSAPPPSASM